MTKEKKQAFRVLVLRHKPVYPTAGVQEIETSVVVGENIVLAEDERGARFLAARYVPEDLAPFHEELEILISPF